MQYISTQQAQLKRLLNFSVQMLFENLLNLVRLVKLKLWGCKSGSHQASLVHTAEEFQTERNSCPVLQPIFQLSTLPIKDEFLIEKF